MEIKMPLISHMKQQRVSGELSSMEMQSLYYFLLRTQLHVSGELSSMEILLYRHNALEKTAVSGELSSMEISSRTASLSPCASCFRRT